MKNLLAFIFSAILFVIGLPLSVQATESEPADGIAFYYASQPPLAEASFYRRVVLQPAQTQSWEIEWLSDRGSQPYAYLSIGETRIEPAPANVLTDNPNWNSQVMDLTDPRWQHYIRQQAAQLLKAGYQGLFLDTLDSYQLARDTDREAQQSALVELIKSLANITNDRLILNRGFEVLPQLRGNAESVVAEGLYSHYAPLEDSYGPTTKADQEWLLGKLYRARQLGFHTQVIDYSLAGESRSTLAQKVLATGHDAWVTDGHLTQWGTGQYIPVPRRVMMVFNSESDPLTRADIHIKLATMVEYLGYVPDYHDIKDGIPGKIDPALYSGVIFWPESASDYSTPLEDWLLQLMGKTPVMILGQPPENPTLLTALGARSIESTPPYHLKALAPEFKSEHKPGFYREPLSALEAAEGGKSWLTFLDANNRPVDQLITSENGALIADPWLIRYLPDFSSRWVIDPVSMLRIGLQLEDIPAIDVTTENGRRLLMAHIDGDGFPNRSHLRGTPYTSEVIHKQILDRYKLPTTVSVIEGEIGPQSKHRSQSAELEQIARQIFSEDYVELASHSFSHPFFWEVFAKRRAINVEATDYGFHLDIPGYKFNLEREITGSINYINNRLAPPEKRVKMMLWTGDALPAGDAIRLTKANNVLNLNGGDTWVLNDNPTLSRIWPLARPEGDGLYQIYAPIMNENVYTNLWNGPFYGYRRVIETFKITGSPYRLKPLSIYYHFYSADNPAGLKALRQVYDYALSRPHTAIYLSDYAQRAEDFYNSALARDHQGSWHLNSRFIRTLRVSGEYAAPHTGGDVAGYTVQPQGTYLHLANSKARIAFGSEATLPFLDSANVILQRWQQDGNRIELSFTAYEEAELVIAQARRCTFKSYKSQQRRGKQILRLPKGNWSGTLHCKSPL